MDKRPIEEANYGKLIRLIPNLESIDEYVKLTSAGFMNLGVDVLEISDDYRIIALSHYYLDSFSGDMIPDPDMTIKITTSVKPRKVETLTYQDLYTFQQVYLREDVKNRAIQASLDNFLSQWLDNLLSQGHKQ